VFSPPLSTPPPLPPPARHLHNHHYLLVNLAAAARLSPGPLPSPPLLRFATPAAAAAATGLLPAAPAFYALHQARALLPTLVTAPASPRSSKGCPSRYALQQARALLPTAPVPAPAAPLQGLPPVAPSRHALQQARARLPTICFPSARLCFCVGCLGGPSAPAVGVGCYGVYWPWGLPPGFSSRPPWAWPRCPSPLGRLGLWALCPRSGVEAIGVFFSGPGVSRLALLSSPGLSVLPGRGPVPRCHPPSFPPSRLLLGPVFWSLRFQLPSR
jgi:hypothetical protein